MRYTAAKQTLRRRLYPPSPRKRDLGPPPRGDNGPSPSSNATNEFFVGILLLETSVMYYVDQE